MSDLTKMIRYATIKHGDQKRKKNGRPYCHDHCLKLLQSICVDPVLGYDDDAALIIVGHDIVEDCTENDTDEERDALYLEITCMFGNNVCTGIRELTNEYTKARYPNQNRAKRKERELKRLIGISDRSKTLKLYDRLINLEDSIADEDWNKTYAQESWNIGNSLNTIENAHVAIKVLTLAIAIQERCKK